MIIDHPDQDAMPALPDRNDGLMNGFRTERVATKGAEINVAIGGDGPPLLFLHGNPLTHVSWHKVAPTPARSFTVVAPDLRGYGTRTNPAGGEAHQHARASVRAKWWKEVWK